jgi:hypothetical protein
MPTGDELPALKRCDFSRTVLITSTGELPQAAGDRAGTARITAYGPNRVSVEVDGAGGWLVLSDVWFPGWICRVDGSEVAVYRANHAFRAVPVPAGSKSVEFTFSPRSYRIGWWISASTLAVLVGGVGVGGLLRLRRREVVPPLAK